MLGPNAQRVVAIEVKGTLRPGYWPRLRGGELRQMDLTWLDKSDNPGMGEWNLASSDVFGGVALVNFAERQLKLALTREFATWHPIERAELLEALEWID